MNHVARATDKADVVLVDCPPDVMSPSFNALLEYPANLLLAIARLEPGTPAPLQTLTGLAIANRMPHLVLPNAKSAKANSTGVLIALQQLYCGTQVLPEGAAVPSLLRTVPDSQAASTAIAENVPVTVLRPKSPISKAFAEVAADLVAWGVV